MAAKGAAAKEKEIIIVNELQFKRVQFYVRGMTPLIFHAMSEKARRVLLFPKPGKKTKADKEQTLKHNPLEEYRDSVYQREGTGPTRIIAPSVWFKRAICHAALDTPGAVKAQLGRLTWVQEDTIDVYGVPKLLMSVVRCADANKTPDIRTRAILTDWACCVEISFVSPTLNEASIGNLLSNAGLIGGVGDGRQQKGTLSYGRFLITSQKECEKIMKSGGIKEQDAALKKPDFYDVESRTLYRWFEEEKKKRGKS